MPRRGLAWRGRLGDLVWVGAASQRNARQREAGDTGYRPSWRVVNAVGLAAGRGCFGTLAFSLCSVVS
jgi:hypothetical protein